jgi:hypothetical protein
MFYEEEFEVGVWAIENTPINAVWLTPTYPGTPMTSIAGRTALMTFPGWAWTHGIYNLSRQQLMEELWKQRDPELFRTHSVQYVYKNIGRENHTFDVGVDTRWMKVFESKAVEVWRVVDGLI